jgi:hypothetical protein
MNRICDAGGICPHDPQCASFCQFTAAELETRKIAPYPAVPADIEPVPETLHTMGSILLGLAIAVLMVFFGLMFFTGMWIWSLLI